MSPSDAAQLYHVRKTVDAATKTLRQIGDQLTEAKVDRAEVRKDIDQIQANAAEQAAETKSLRHEVRGYAQKIQSAGMLREVQAEASKPIDIVTTAPHPTVVEETKARTKLWATITAFVAAIGTWLGIKLGGG